MRSKKNRPRSHVGELRIGGVERLFPLASGIAKADAEFARWCKMEKGHGAAPTVDFGISTGSTTTNTSATPSRRCFRFCFRFERMGAQKKLRPRKGQAF